MAGYGKEQGHKRQEVLAREIIKLIENDHPIDQAGALGSVFLTQLLRFAEGPEKAMGGLEAHFGDMKNTLVKHFREQRDQVVKEIIDGTVH